MPKTVASAFGYLLCGCNLLVALTSHAQPVAAIRSWTDTQGRKVEAAFGGVQNDSVLLKLANGQTVPFPLARLSTEDQAFVKLQSPGQEAAPPASAIPAKPRVPIAKRTWPQNVEVPSRSIEINVISESPADRKYIYRSEGFEFVSQAKLAGSVMKEVARTFEATRSLINALPWGVVCQPPVGFERFQAALFETRDDYVAAGGPAISGGVYSTGDKIFKVPFESMGLQKRGQTYYKDEDYRADTLVHEITHQMMDEYLGFLPMWVVEGSAEYTEMLPYRAGIFRADNHKNAIKEVVENRTQNAGLAAEIEVERHMTMTRDGWALNGSSSGPMAHLYFRSQLLVYYFCHLDGDKNGTRFMAFMEAVHGDVLKLRAFFADPRVKRLEGGRFSYPSDFPPPDMDSNTAPFKHLPLLLAGRDYAQLAKEVVEGYKTIGLKVQVK